MDDLRAKIANAISGWYAGGDEPTWGDYQIAEVVMQVLREQEPIAWLHRDPSRVDVIHDEVKRLLERSDAYFHRPLGSASLYALPLYAAPMPPSVPDGLASALHYPDCWDTAAYPTVESALQEVTAWFRCTECDQPSVPFPSRKELVDFAVEDMEQDVKLYRWLRAQHWSDNVIAVVLRPKDAVKLGYDCPSGVRLDEVIIAAMENENG